MRCFCGGKTRQPKKKHCCFQVHIIDRISLHALWSVCRKKVSVTQFPIIRVITRGIHGEAEVSMPTALSLPLTLSSSSSSAFVSFSFFLSSSLPPFYCITYVSSLCYTSFACKNFLHFIVIIEGWFIYGVHDIILFKF
jgi:hypothetical protein